MQNSDRQNVNRRTSEAITNYTPPRLGTKDEVLLSRLEETKRPNFLISK